MSRWHDDTVAFGWLVALVGAGYALGCVVSWWGW